MDFRPHGLAAVATVATCITACGLVGAPPGGPEAAAAPSSAPRNAEYSIQGQPVRLVDGVAERPAAPGSAARIITRYFGNEARGDLDADGRDDVMFLLTQETGGSGTFFYAVAALDRDGGYRGSRGVLLGDRIAPQSTEIRADGIVVVSYADRAAGESLAARPTVSKSIWLKLDPATLEFAVIQQN